MSAPAVTVGDMSSLRHMLGMNERRRREWGYRNHYAAAPGDASMARLAALGWVKKNERVSGSELSGGDDVFNATFDGCLAAGMTAAEALKTTGGPSDTKTTGLESHQQEPKGTP